MNTLGDDKFVSLNANLFIALFAVNKHMPFEWSASICGGLNDFNSLVSTLKNFIVVWLYLYLQNVHIKVILTY